MRTTFDIEIETTVLNGLPVLAAGNIAPAEADVGFAGAVEDITLYIRPGERARWAETRMSADDWGRVEDELWDRANEEPDCDYHYCERIDT